ncbi:hypothetical protein D039_1135A, partial [Vibrio parahaemolyticus EKP-028]
MQSQYVDVAHRK